MAVSLQSIKTSGVHGLAPCIVRRITYEDHTERCIFKKKKYMWQTLCVAKIPKRKAYMSLSC